GCGRLPWAGDLFGSAGLQIKHVLVRRTTNQIDEDNRLVGRPDPGGRLSPQKAGKGEAAKPKGSDPEETPAGQAVRDGGQLSNQAVAGRHRYLGTHTDGGVGPEPDAGWWGSTSVPWPAWNSLTGFRARVNAFRWDSGPLCLTRRCQLCRCGSRKTGHSYEKRKTKKRKRDIL